jgi:hypothetical protein
MVTVTFAATARNFAACAILGLSRRFLDIKRRLGVFM